MQRLLALHGLQHDLDHDASVPAQDVVCDDPKEATSAVYPSDAISPPLARIGKATTINPESVPFGVEKGNAEAVLRVDEVLHHEACARCRRLHHCSAIPAGRADLLHGRAPHAESEKVADLDGADWRQASASLLLLHFVGFGQVRRNGELQRRHVQAVRHDVPHEGPHLTHQLRACHLAIPDARKQLFCLRLVELHLWLRNPMPIPTDQSLKQVDLVNSRRVRT
mmetsp:Transcript_13985/g.38211  ORF Transcript_13985/g.38211 Transcript_13985/m.38211 type:complete len:224 (-) Transcript_13985:699-1370(-)